MKIKKLQLFKTYVLMVALMAGATVNAQFLPNSSAPYNSPTYLINSVLLGNGVTATNIQYQGKPIQIGYFTGGTSGNVNMGIDSGIVLSTGDIFDIAGTSSGNIATSTQTANNVPSDPDILQIIQTNNAGGSANDAAIIEFDFTPLGDTVKFDYMFGSEEYPEFVCSFNDGFGMFLSGPGVNGPYFNNAANIAIVPGTNPPVPVSIYNVNQTTSTCAWANNNSSLYVSNGGTDFAFDGFTQVFTAISPVQCGATYHLKIALADANDHTYDSGVLLKARSLVSNQVSFIPTSSSGIVGDSSLVEGCQDGYLTFNRPGNIDSTLVVYIDINSPTAPIPGGWGTATEGVDFNILPDSIVFLPGVPQIVIPVHPFQDAINETAEGIAISLQFQSGCGGLTQFTRYMYIINPDSVQANLPNVWVCPGDSATLVATPQFGYPPYTFLWSTGDTTNTITVLTVGDSALYSVTITSTCTGTTDSDSAYVYTTPYNPITITTVSASPSIENCGDTLLISINLTTPTTIPMTLGIDLPTGFFNATNGLDYVTTNNQPFPSSVDFAVGDSVVIIPLIVLSDLIAEGTETVEIGLIQSSQCSGFVNPLFIDIQDFDTVSIALNSPSPVCPGVEFNVLANATGTNVGVGYTYSWANNTSTTNSAAFTLNSNGPITVTVTDDVCGQQYTVSKTINITVSPTLTAQPIISTMDTVLCPNDAVMLSVSAAGTSPLHYAWLGISSTSNTITVNPDTTTTYLVNITDACNTAGITQIKTIIVPEYTPLSISMINDTTVNCPGTSVILQPVITGGAISRSYFWNDLPSTTPATNFNVNDSNFVTVKFMVTDVCLDTATAYANLRYKTYHGIVLTAGNDTSACPDAKIKLPAKISRVGYDSNYYTYNWVSLDAQTLISTNNKITGADSLATFTILSDVIDTMIYIVSATDICNIVASDTIQIVRKATCKPKIYNVFSPTSGSKNSRFSITEIEEYPNTQVQIFDRWGRTVFETENYKNDDPTNSWDAANVDGGTFYYVATFRVPPGQTKAPEQIKKFVEVIK